MLDKTEEQKLEKAVEFYKFAVNSQKIRFDFKSTDSIYIYIYRPLNKEDFPIPNTRSMDNHPDTHHLALPNPNLHGAHSLRR